MINRGTSFLSLALIFFISLLAKPFTAQTSVNPWQDVNEFALLTQSSGERQIIPESYRTISLDKETLKSVLTQAPMRYTEEAYNSDLRLSLPMPDGTIEAFRIVDAPIMAPGLAARYPEIHSYAGQGIDDPTAYVRFGVTQKGFHAMILSARHSTVFIDAYAKNDTNNYISYYKTDYNKRVEDNFSCLTEGKTKQEISEEENPAASLFVAGGDCQLRTYRMALACTQEYANFHGGTKPSVLAEYNVAMNRVNGVYETDFAVTMVLIDNTDDIIFLSEPDPYTNNNGGTMLGQNQTTCNNVIGAANYDIGHVFSTGGGGIAGLGVPCSNSKAQGVTGLGSPVNDPFYIDYVAHEIGHQFGANHTFNNSCGGNRNNSTAMEPGSASTIMGYAGICPPNVQSNSDPYFHAISLVEVYNYITVGGGSGCPVVTNMPNNPPVISTPNTTYNVPANTPFKLEVVATDPDGGGSLTYCWEQMDNEISTQAPLATNTGGPNFRSLNPSESPIRYFPSIDNVINGTTDTWEVLSSVTRSMNFRCVVRDNNMGEGCTDEVDVELEITDEAGPFLVLNPNTNITWTVGENQTVTWDVANTDQAPISCANVDIVLSTDGGNTYPITLATSVLNNGSALISVPNNLTTTARVMVVCSDNVFFDISNQNFTIAEPLVPTFTMTSTPSTIAICNDATATYTLDLVSLASFNENTTLSVSGLPDGATATFSSNPVTPSATPTMTISNLDGAVAGDYTLTIEGNSASVNNSTTVILSLAAGLPLVENLTSPTNNQQGVTTFPTLEWASVGGATNYEVVVSTTSTFDAGTIIFTGNTSTNNIATSELGEETVYYWQVSATSDCGAGGFSSTSSFLTGAEVCDTYTSTDIPIDIPSDAVGTVTSTLEIADDIAFTNLDVFINIRHTWVGDVTVTLTSPMGTTATLVDQPGFPASSYGCGEDNIVVTLDDEATNTAADLESTCAGGVPSIEGTFQSIDALSAFHGESAQGTWTLSVSDAFGEDGGNIDAWNIFGCSISSQAPAPPVITGAILDVPQGNNEVITATYLQASSPDNTPSELIFTVVTLPTNGTLILNGMTLSIGSTFTQEDINTGALSYMHDNTATTSDSFDYSIVNNQGGWLPNATFNVNIIQNNLSATAMVVAEIDCNGNETGSISTSITGGTPDFSYSLDGVNFQDLNTFNDLGAGNYTITVRDDFGFEVTTSAVILTEPDLITINNTIVTNTITVNAGGGTPGYEYSLNSGSYQSSNVFENLGNGDYEVCVRDINGCISCKMETIAVNNLTANASITNDITCNNQNNGTITVTAGGGQEPYTYSINAGTPQSSNVFSFLTEGIYAVLVSDNDGFTITTNSVTITNPSAINTSNSVIDNTITVTASGGTGNLVYSLNGDTPQSSNVFTDLENGSYEICAIDENDCEECQTSVVAVNTILASATLTMDISCNNENDASITVNAAGGQEPYSYSLNNGTAQASNIFNGLSSGDYIVLVTDNTGFEVTTNQVTIFNPTTISSNNTVVNNTITVIASGGTGNLAYSIDGISYQVSNIFEGLENGTYTVCVRDENNCEVCETATIAVNNVSATATLTSEVSCINETDASITVNAAGGQTPYSYSINGEMAQSSNVFETLGAGTYNIVVEDADGFTINTNQITISNPTVITVTADVLNSQVTVNANGGTGNYQYSSNGVDFISSNVFIFNENGVYTIYVQDENGCLSMTNVEINVVEISATIAIQNNLNCNNGSDACVAITVVGATAPITYELNEITQENNAVFCGLSAGIYSATITDANGMTFTTAAVTIENPPAIVLDYSITCDLLSTNYSGGTGNLVLVLDGNPIEDETTLDNGEYVLSVQDENACTVSDAITINALEEVSLETEDTSCSDEEDGSITVNIVSGGTQPFEYSLDNGSLQTSNTFEDLTEGDYDVSVFDSNGCEINAMASITSPLALTAIISITANNATITAQNANGEVQYSIDGGDTFQTENTFSDLPNGDYTVIIEDEQGCTTDVSFSILLDGINDLPFDLDFGVQPNPNNGTFQLLVNMPTEEDLIVRVFDVAGKQIFRNVYVKNGILFSEQISLENIASGTYFVTVSDGKVAGTKELVIF